MLFVSGDETVPGPVAELADPALAPHALGLLLAADAAGAPLRLGLEACRTEAEAGALARRAGVRPLVALGGTEAANRPPTARLDLDAGLLVLFLPTFGR